MKKLLLSLLILMSAGQLVHAQWAYGAKAGVSVARITDPPLIDLLPTDIKSISSLTVGGMVMYRLHPHAALQAELVYKDKGFAIREYFGFEVFNYEIPVGITIQHRVKHVELPLLLRGMVGNRQFSLAGYAGPAVAYATSGKITAKPHLFIDFKGYDLPMNLDSWGYNRWELSGIAGLEAAVRLHNLEIFADGRYQYGLTRIYDFPVIDVKSMNRAVEITAGFRINL